MWEMACATCGGGKEFATTLHYGAKICVDLSDPMSRYPIAYGGMNEPVLYQAICSALSPGDVFVDIGANFGYYTLLAAGLVGNQGHVYGFEPLPRVAEQLKRNVALNHLANVTVHEAAVGDSCREATMFVPVRAQSGIATLATPTWIKDRAARQIQVPVTTLDDAFGDRELAIGVMKIDAEGYELRILRGARRLLSGASPPIVFCEVQPDTVDEIIGFLCALGYKTFRLHPEGLIAVNTEITLDRPETICALRPDLHEPPLDYRADPTS